MDDIKIIDNELHNLLSANALYKIAKQKNINVSLKQIKDYKNSLEHEQLTKQSKRKIQGHITAFYPNGLWQMDLMDLQNLQKKNHGYKYILMIIDVFTRRAFNFALKNKTKESIVDVFKWLLPDITPATIVSDNGKEFDNHLLGNLLDKYGVRNSFTDVGNHKALGIIDRYTRTLKTLIRKLFAKNQNSNWVDHLKELTEIYNKTPTSALNYLSPDEVLNSADNFNEVVKLNEMKQKVNDKIKLTNKFKVGQEVRIRNKKYNSLKKGWISEWSKDIYVIDKVNNVTAIVDGEKVRLEDLQLVTKRPQNISIVKRDFNKEIIETVKRHRNKYKFK